MNTTDFPAPGSPHTSQEHTTAQRYRDTLRILDDGCQACNMSKVYCDAIWYNFDRPCCGMCGHP